MTEDTIEDVKNHIRERERERERETPKCTMIMIMTMSTTQTLRELNHATSTHFLWPWSLNRLDPQNTPHCLNVIICIGFGDSQPLLTYYAEHRTDRRRLSSYHYVVVGGMTDSVHDVWGRSSDHRRRRRH